MAWVFCVTCQKHVDEKAHKEAVGKLLPAPTVGWSQGRIGVLAACGHVDKQGHIHHEREVIHKADWQCVKRCSNREHKHCSGGQREECRVAFVALLVHMLASAVFHDMRFFAVNLEAHGEPQPTLNVWQDLHATALLVVQRRPHERSDDDDFDSRWAHTILKSAPLHMQRLKRMMQPAHALPWAVPAGARCGAAVVTYGPKHAARHAAAAPSHGGSPPPTARLACGVSRVPGGAAPSPPPATRTITVTPPVVAPAPSLPTGIADSQWWARPNAAHAVPERGDVARSELDSDDIPMRAPGSPRNPQLEDDAGVLAEHPFAAHNSDLVAVMAFVVASGERFFDLDDDMGMLSSIDYDVPMVSVGDDEPSVYL